MIEVAEVQPEGCIYELCLDIMLGWRGMRSMFGYTTLYEIILHRISIL